jgi:hypothetical protein
MAPRSVNRRVRPARRPAHTQRRPGEAHVPGRDLVGGAMMPAGRSVWSSVSTAGHTSARPGSWRWTAPTAPRFRYSSTCAADAVWLATSTAGTRRLPGLPGARRPPRAPWRRCTRRAAGRQTPAPGFRIFRSFSRASVTTANPCRVMAFPARLNVVLGRRSMVPRRSTVRELLKRVGTVCRLHQEPDCRETM